MKKVRLPANLRGKYVSRASFAKMQGEKQRLEKDIKIMVMGGADGREVWEKWLIHFKKIQEFNNALFEISKQELPRLKEKYGIQS